MKIVMLVCCVFCFSHVFAQDLANTEWTQVKLERKDGSRVVDHIQSANSITRYYFKEKVVLIAIDNLFIDEQAYEINGKVLSIGAISKYNIDTIGAEILQLTQIPLRSMTDDRINRITFVSRQSLFKYAADNQKITIIGDSLIEYSSQMAPAYYGHINNLLTGQFGFPTENKKIVGSFILDAKGMV